MEVGLREEIACRGKSIYAIKLILYGESGVKVGGVYEDTWTPEVLAYDPEHPDADENGYVHGPNVNVVTEMTNMIDASRGYDANQAAFEAVKAMALKGLEGLSN